jgi:tetratricopeptide (TPR) repeat protein
MRSLLLFFFLTFLTGNPILAILIIVGIYLFLDYQFVGFSHRLFKGVRRGSTIRMLERGLLINPNDAAAQSDLGRLLVEAGRYREAVPVLEKAMDRMSESEETRCDLGLAYLWTGKPDEGQRLIQEAMEQNPKFRYGDPLMRWGLYLVKHGQPQKAAGILEKFLSIHSSSVEGHYLLGEAYRMTGRWREAREIYRRANALFRQSPGYKRRAERLWVWMVRFRLLVGGAASERSGR